MWRTTSGRRSGSPRTRGSRNGRRRSSFPHAQLCPFSRLACEPCSGPSAERGSQASRLNEVQAYRIRLLRIIISCSFAEDRRAERAPAMYPFPSLPEIRDLIDLAKREDLSADDVTSRLMVAEDAVGVGTLVQKEVGIACGLPI